MYAVYIYCSEIWGGQWNLRDKEFAKFTRETIIDVTYVIEYYFESLYSNNDTDCWHYVSVW